MTTANAKTIHLHIGANKTGSSSFLSTLRELTRIGQGRIDLHYDDRFRGLAKTIRNQLPFSPQDLAAHNQFFHQQFDALPATNIVVMNNLFIGTAGKAFSDTEVFARTAQAFFQGFKVKVQAFFRRQDSYLESQYVQGIKNNAYDHSFGEFLENIRWRTSVDYHRMLGVYAEIFGADNVTAYPYDMYVADPTGFLQAVYRGIGVEGVSIGNLPNLNPGVSMRGVEVLRRCNSILQPQERIKLRQFVEQHLTKKIGETYGFFDDAARRELMAAYWEANQRLFADFVRVGKDYLSAYQPD